MSIDMYLEAARTQATSLTQRVGQLSHANESLLKALASFADEDELKGLAYDSAKSHVNSTLIPLVQGIVLYQEALALACRQFVDRYVAEVDGKSWRESDLEEQIKAANQLISALNDILLNSSLDGKKQNSLVDISAENSLLTANRDKLQEILDKLIAFNASSPEIFAEAESLYQNVQTGFSQAGISWDSQTKTYLPPRTDADLSWKQTVSEKWTKRQEMIQEIKNPKIRTTEERIAQMSRDDIEEEYSSIVAAYWKGETRDYRWRGKFTQSEMIEADLVLKRYEEALKESPGLSKQILDQVDPAFKKKIDSMDQKQLEKEFPGLKRSPLAPFYEHGFYSSKTDYANDVYLVARYQELDSLNPVSKHDPDFDQKRFEYINKTGIDPVTNKKADKELKNYAKNYTTFAPGIKAGYDFTMTVLGGINARAYDNDLSVQKADMLDDVLQDASKVDNAQKVDGYDRTKSYYQKKFEFYGNNQPIVTYNYEDLSNLQHTENFTDKSLVHIFEGDIKRGKAGGYHYDMIEGTSGRIIDGTKELPLNKIGVYQAQVEVDGIPKKSFEGYSTFFPDQMSPQEVIDAINDAYTNKIFSGGNTYIGKAGNGLKIEMYINPDGKIISAFPKK